MAHRPSRRRAAEKAKSVTWESLPDSVFGDLGVDRAALTKFERGLVGTVVLPGEPAYDVARRTSFQVSPHNPKIIVYCEIDADVRACLAWARRCGWWVAVRSGGHSTAAYSVNDGMVIDVSRMNHVHVDAHARRAVVGAGTDFAKLNAVLDSFRLHVTGGACGDVAVGGYMQGGGYGFTAREFGMNCDAVAAFRMMLADGRVVTASEARNHDLFWAVRGGTGNNFGVLLDVTYRLQEVWQLWGFGLAWRLDDAASVLCELQENYMTSGASRQLGYMAMINHRAGHPTLSLRGTFNGSPEDGRRALAPLVRIGTPTIEIDAQDSYRNLETLLYDEALVEFPGHVPIREDKQAGYIARRPAPADWQHMLDYYVRTSPKPYNLIVIEPYGGAINAVAADATAFVHRNADMDFYVDSFWVADAEESQARRWLDEFMTLMAPYFNGEVYQNYPRRGLSDYRRRYWGANYDRLLAVKNKYDPVPHAFHFEQGICTSPDDAGVPLGRGAPASFTAAPIVYDPDAASIADGAAAS